LHYLSAKPKNGIKKYKLFEVASGDTNPSFSPKYAIADYLIKPLAKLTPEQMSAVNSILSTTLNKQEVMSQIKAYFSDSAEEV